MMEIDPDLKQDSEAANSQFNGLNETRSEKEGNGESIYSFNESRPYVVKQ